VDPVRRDRPRVALEESPRQRNLEVTILERQLLGGLAVTAQDANVRPEGAFLVQRSVLLAVLPDSDLLLPFLNRRRRMYRDLAVRGPKALQALQVQPQHHGVRPLITYSLDHRLADAEWTPEDEQRFYLVRPDLHGVVLALGRDLELGFAIFGKHPSSEQTHDEQQY